MILIRPATPNDLPAILEVEQSWPEDARASADKFLARLEKFPQGFLLACVSDDSGKQRVVGTITAMPLRYDPLAIDRFKTWDQVTNNGYLHDVDLASCNALYIVSGVIDSRYRGINVFGPGVLREVELAQSLGMRYIVAGAVIPGYKKYCRQHGEVSAYDYCTTRRGSHLADPLLAMYETIGFSVRDAQHVIQEYYPDDASRNFAALVVRDLKVSTPGA
jgi:hypothetical protein